ncbi:MAG: U-box domain [Gammaproteobacteria bacterium]|jgi:hypothetical protein|nr:U-box domain [Gammaproteobacteria bacterium]
MKIIEVHYAEEKPKFVIHPPDNFYCPITLQIFCCPVKVSPDDRKVYEALAIARSIKYEMDNQSLKGSGPKSPCSRTPIEAKLIFDLELRQEMQQFFVKAKKRFEQEHEAILEDPQHKDYQDFNEFYKQLNELADKAFWQKQTEKVVGKLQEEFPMIELIGFDNFTSNKIALPADLEQKRKNVKPKNCLPRLLIYNTAHCATSFSLSLAATIISTRAVESATSYTSDTTFYRFGSYPSLMLQAMTTIGIDFPASLIFFFCNSRSSLLNHIMLGAANLIPAISYGILAYFAYWEHIIAQASTNISPEFALTALILYTSTAALNIARTIFHFARGAQAYHQSTMPSPRPTLQIKELENTTLSNLTIEFNGDQVEDEAGAAPPTETTRLLPS